MSVGYLSVDGWSSAGYLSADGRPWQVREKHACRLKRKEWEYAGKGVSCRGWSR
ncbi:hypothetical protein BRYFOR_05381 [Marvinbryantia formatexigens DSM 14469]|uniref:Uncharacterized protein n=1 Tax=Marvinbryantia formatexigens DSM 14469 TaxID=478749 RepID=C6L9U1_9FIRM|nr:hypothetical protein BRYFOR_05381 [Marvinbryantia formatexigens DSM 14469]